tara:strand:+ start:11108 stop:12145 length:1038 start_codon:yes stop_codon:yes gene_type:complete
MNSFIQKIHKNFEKSIQDYDKVSKSKYWSQSINKKKKLFNKKSLKDFRSNNLSKNIDDFYIDKTKTKKLYKNLEKECGKKFIKNFLLVNNIGNAKKILKIDNKIITPSDLFHIKYLHDLKKKINLNKIDTICEIGQGFGLLISKLLKVKNYKIILIDLPESNYLTAYFLKKVFPHKKIVMDVDLPEKKLNKNIFNQGEIFILSPWIKIKNIKIDLFINSRSMMEMNHESIINYFKLIHEKISKNGYFLCINRYYKDLVGYPVELHRYPFDNKWKILISKKSWMQEHIHFLLLKKVSKNKSNINLALSAIKNNYIKIVKKDNFFLRRWLPISFYRNYKLAKYFIFK